MRSDRVVRILRPSLALLAIAAVLILVGLVITSSAAAAGAAAVPSPVPSAAPATHGNIIEFGHDVTLPAGESADAVVVGGGDVVIDGQVMHSVVTFGGNVLVRGAIGDSLVAFGSDVHLAPGARVGTAKKASNGQSVVVFGGSLTRDPGSEVNGSVHRFAGASLPAALSWGTRHALLRPWWGFSLLSWVVQMAVFLVLGLVAAALLPGQMRAVQRHLTRSPAGSLGWGALGVFIIVPGVLIALIISIIGLLLVLPYIVVVPLFYFFVITTVAAFVADRLLVNTQQKDNLMLAVVIGVIGTTIISRIPIAGFLALLVMAVFGTGAAGMAFVEWRRAKRAVATAPPAPPPAPPAAAGPPADG